MSKKYKLSTIIFIFFVFAPSVFATTFFSGFAGGKLNYSTIEGSEEYSPELKLQAFFQGQFNFSKNLWSHLEISLNTQNLISQSIFHETDSVFQIDEMSLIYRTPMENSANYLGVFMGTFDPIGSDVFLQRYFGIDNISSKITESWLGLAGSILYPHFGIGFSDVLRFYSSPMAAGFYFYVNHEDEDYYVVNSDLRYACVYRYLYLDVACGLGAPIKENKEYIAAIEKLYWHAGITALIGNNFTNSLFIQMGLFNASFTKQSESLYFKPSDTYILIEPRFKVGSTRLNFSFYSLPQNTVDKLLFVDNSLGISINFYSDAVSFVQNRGSLGLLFSYSFPEKSFIDLKDIKNLGKWDFELSMTPYFSTGFLNGELHVQTKINFMKFATAKWFDAFTVDLGFKTSL